VSTEFVAYASDVSALIDTACGPGTNIATTLNNQFDAALKSAHCGPYSVWEASVTPDFGGSMTQRLRCPDEPRLQARGELAWLNRPANARHASWSTDSA
jgi:hypothetical protein